MLDADTSKVRRSPRNLIHKEKSLTDSPSRCEGSWKNEESLEAQDLFKDHTDEDPGTILATLKSGNHFGDIAIFENCQRTANVRAKTSVKLLELKRGTAMLMKESINSSSN